MQLILITFFLSKPQPENKILFVFLLSKQLLHNEPSLYRQRNVIRLAKR